MLIRVLSLICALSITLPAWAGERMRLSHGYSTGYLPLMIVRDQHLLEKHAAAMGLGSVETSWQALDGGNVINDAMLAGSLDAAGIGVPGFITLWSKTRSVARGQVIGVSAISGGTLWLNSNNPRVKTLRDFTDRDRIAVPGIKTSFAAVALQMAAAKEFGIADYARLDALTVGMPHPEAAAALMSGGTELTAHMASPPFNHLELTSPKVHRVLNTMDVFGPLTILMTMASKPYADAHPKMMEALLAATEEAVGFIAAHKREAAETYVRVMKSKSSVDEILAILDDPESVFGTTPVGSMEYARFLGRTGVIKVVPGGWTEMFIPALAGKSGT